MSATVATMNAVDRSSGMPLYLQIKRILAEELRQADGESPMMTESELVERFHVSRATVRQALRELVSNGIVYRDRAKGTFPVKRLNIERPAALKLGGLISYLADQGLDPSSIVSDARRGLPPKEVGATLELDPEEAVLMFTRRVLAQGVPLSYAHIYLRSPEGFFPTADELEKAGSAIALLERAGGPSVARAEHHVWAAGATTEESEALAIGLGDPVLVAESLMVTRDGSPLAWRRIVDRSDGIRHVFISHSEGT